MEPDHQRASLEALSANTPEPYRAQFVGRVRNDESADSTVLVERERILGTGLTETITVRNYSRTPFPCSMSIVVDTDFANLFEVKEGHRSRLWKQRRQMDSDHLTLEAEWNGHHHAILVTCHGAHLQDRSIVSTATVRAHGEYVWTITAAPQPDRSSTAAAREGHQGTKLPLQAKSPEHGESFRRITEWRAAMPVADLGDDAVEKVIRQSQEDLGSLRIFNPDHPDRAVVTAGAPWFMALFGRDSLFASYMSLLLDPSLALGTLRTLADYQGKEVNPL